MKHILFALGVSVAYAQNYPCTVSDGVCVESTTPAPATETIHPITRAEFTATAVLADSCTWCGKNTESR